MHTYTYTSVCVLSLVHVTGDDFCACPLPPKPKAELLLPLDILGVREIDAVNMIGAFPPVVVDYLKEGRSIKVTNTHTRNTCNLIYIHTRARARKEYSRNDNHDM